VIVWVAMPWVLCCRLAAAELDHSDYSDYEQEVVKAGLREQKILSARGWTKSRNVRTIHRWSSNGCRAHFKTETGTRTLVECAVKHRVRRQPVPVLKPAVAIVTLPAPGVTFSKCFYAGPEILK
jgi:hypothetical protein